MASAADCDDNDPVSSIVAEDGDCDGVATAADCDDSDPSVPNQAGCWQSVSAGDLHSCGVTSSGSVQCWGYNDGGQSTPPTGSFQSVSAGGYHTCGLTSSGSVECWGYNDEGQSIPPF